MRRNKIKLSIIEKKYGILVGIIVSLIICAFIYYSVIVHGKEELHQVFVEAEQYYARKEYDKAIEKYNEYLADTTTFESAKRWAVWQRLLYITIQLQSDLTKGIAILKTMEKEYEYDVQYMPQVLKEMVQVYHMQRAKEDMMQTLEKLITSDFPLEQQEKVKLYRQYALIIAEDARNFERGEEQLGLCIEKEEEAVVQWCQYELGVIYTLDARYKKARAIYDTLIKKSKPNEELYYSSRFMLATIYGLLGEKKQAIEEFQAIEEIYPNKDAIQSRIRALRKAEKNEL